MVKHVILWTLKEEFSEKEKQHRLHEGKYRVEWCADRLHEKEYYTAFL